MKRFTEAGRAAVKANNYYASLSLALTIPDICGSLEEPGPGKSQKRYERWFKQWAEPKFTFNGQAFLSAHDCYQLRCSLIHSGSTEIDPKKQDILSQIVFFGGNAGPHLTWTQGNTFNGVLQPAYLQMRTDLFSEAMYKSADEWDAAVEKDEKIQAEKAKLLVIKMPGAMIGGIQYGR